MHANFKDLTNQQFGDWKVLSLLPKTCRGQATKWICRCSCGREKQVFATSLLAGRSTCCAICNHRSYIRSGTSERDLFYHYSKNAIARGYSFELTPEEFSALTTGDCHYCGRSPEQQYKPRRKYTEPYIYNGID